MESFLKNFDLVPFDVVMICVCALLFVVFWQVISPVLWQPYLALIEARERATIGAQAGASDARTRAAELRRQFDEKIGNARISAMEKKLTVLESAKKEAHQLVEKAEGAAQEHVRSMRWEIGSKMEDFQRRAASEVEGLSKVIVDRVKSISSSKGQSSLHSIFLFALLLLPTAYAHAAGGDGSAAITDLKWPWVNFAIYVALLTYLLRKPLAAAWSTRRSSFIDLIGAAQREAEQARQELSAAEAKIATLNTELVRVAADIEKEGVREAGDLITEAKKRAERIVAQGKDLALAEKRSTEESIRREIVEQALSRAEANLRSELNVDSDKPLRDAAVSAVRGLVQ